MPTLDLSYRTALMNRFQKLLALSPYQWYLLVSAMILLPAIRLSLNLFGFKKTYNRIINSYISNQSQADVDSSQLLEAKRVARMIDIAAAHGLYRANCLTRSLLLMLALNKRKIPCRLMIGANERRNIEKKDFGAHAWVESSGNVLNDLDNVSTRFKAFPLPKGLLK